ncbi:MAG: hypothetical protein HY515_02050 [Candidatus Aenigmarchaeota archaeon]|nr:hypothetical protein [Candidatus Aenigmarchaeota archaeon]
MTLQKMFLDLIAEVFDETVKVGRASLDEGIERLRQETLRKAKKDFQSLSGSRLDPYVEAIKGTDYLSAALRQMEAVSEKPSSALEERPKITNDYLRQVVPRLLTEHGYVSAKLISPGNSRPTGSMLSRLSEELGITADPESKKNDTHYVPKVRETGKEGVAPATLSVTYEYLQRVVPGIIAEHGYVSARLVAPGRTAGPAGHMLAHFSEQLGLTRDPATKKGDVHYLAIRPMLTNGPGVGSGHNINPDGRILSQGEKPDPDYMDRIAR